MADKLLEVQNLRTQFFTRSGVVKAVEDVSLYLDQGETLGVGGQSGCGKSVTALSIIRLVGKPGRIGQGNVLCPVGASALLEAPELRPLRRCEIAMLFQD